MASFAYYYNAKSFGFNYAFLFTGLVGSCVAAQVGTVVEH